MTRIYTGIGSRETPPNILKKMRIFARLCAEKGYILRSGGAKGADLAFEAGCQGKRREVPGYKEIYLSGDAEDWCYEEILKYIDPGRNFKSFRPFTQDLLARNMHQILGRDGKTPSNFVVCWTPNGKDVGGTRYALRCARAYGIPIYNLALEEDFLQARELYKQIQSLPEKESIQ